jgi:hypothetical protein
LGSANEAAAAEWVHLSCESDHLPALTVSFHEDARQVRILDQEVAAKFSETYIRFFARTFDGKTVKGWFIDRMTGTLGIEEHPMWECRQLSKQF